MIEQGNTAKAERNGSPGAGAGAPVPRSSSEKSDRPGRLSRAIRPPAHNQERVAAALVGARSRRRRPACLAAAVTRPLLWTAAHPALHANGVPATRATTPEKVILPVDLLVRSGSLNRIRRRVAVARSSDLPTGTQPPRRLAFFCGMPTLAPPGKQCAGDECIAPHATDARAKAATACACRSRAGAPVPRSSSEKSDRPGRLSRAIRPPAHNQERVAAALVGARSRRRRPACLAAAVTRLLLWTAAHPALRANGVPATRATTPEK